MIRTASVRPSSALAELVETYTLYSGNGARTELQRVFPTSAIELTVNLSSGEMRCYDPANFAQTRATGPLLTGLFSRYYVIDTAQLDDMISVRLRPGTAWRLFGTPAHELASQHLALSDLLGKRWDSLLPRLAETADPAARLRILDNSLLSLPRRRDLHPAIGYALDLLKNPPRIPAL
jgi:hypothetical protein